MSPTQEPTIKAVPTIKEVFGIYPKLMDAFKQNYIHSVAAVMLLPKEVLAKMEHFTAKKARLVADMLAEYELAQFSGEESLSLFVEREYGCIEDMPVGALNVVTDSELFTSKQCYRPLLLLAFFEEYEPQMKVIDLLHMSERDIRAKVRGRVELGPVIERLFDDIVEVNWRLSWWDPNLRIQLDTRRGSHLQVVNG